MSFKAFVWAWDQDVPNGDHQHVLLALANIAPARDVRASVPYIARLVRRSTRKVRAALMALEDAGIINITERPGFTDLIRLNIPANFTVSMEDEEDQEAGKRGRPKTPAPSEKPLPNPCQNPSTRGADEPSGTRGTSLVCLDARKPFDVWWERYPLKKAKDAAVVAFEKAMRRIDGPDPLQVLIDGLERYIEEIARTGVLIKHPATWLNQGCWADEPDTHRSQTDGQPASIDRIADPATARVQAMVDGARKAALGGRRKWGA